MTHDPERSGARVEPATPLARAAAAELLGSATVVVVGAGSVVVAGSAGSGLVGVALASGFAFGAAVTATAQVSGGGVNPVLTVGFWVAGRLSGIRAAVYVLAQVVGAILAGVALRLAVPKAFWQPASLGAPLLAHDVAPGRAILIEAVLAFILTTTALALLPDAPRISPAAAGVVLGMFVVAATLVAWPLSGAAINPARAIGPEIVGGTWMNWWVYWLGPTAGGVLGGLASAWITPADTDASGARSTDGRRG